MGEFFGVVCVVDLGLGCPPQAGGAPTSGWGVPRKREVPRAAGPGQSTGVGDAGVVVAVGDEFVVGRAGEDQAVGIGDPIGAVVHFPVIAPAVAGVADDALIGGGDAGLATQLQRPLGVLVEDGQIVQTALARPSSHQQRSTAICR